MNMEIIGHQETRALLDKLSQKALIPQSYLFTGPRSIGKKLVALEFAQKLIGALPSDDGHLDIMILAPEREKEKEKVKMKKLSIKEVRAAQIFLSRYPTLGKRRVVILDEAEELSPGAANGLLKILEEPNETSALILVTHQPGLLPATVLSRLSAIPFSLVPEKELSGYLGRAKSDIPDFFATLGIPGLLIKAERDPAAFREHTEILRDLFQISKLSLRRRLSLSERLAHNEEELSLILEEWLAGMHLRLQQSEGARREQQLLLFFEKVSESLNAVMRREGNARLLIEKMLLTF